MSTLSQVRRVGWYRFRVTFTRRAGGLLAIVLLIAILGGLAMGAVAGARRTQSSFPAFLRHTNASDVGISNAVYGVTSNTPFDAAVVRKIARLPHVQQVGDDTGVDPNIVALVPLHGHVAPGEKPPVLSGSLDGEWSSLDRVTLVDGRLADPRRTDEVVMSASAEREVGVHVGSVVPMGFFTNAQLAMPDCCSATGTGRLAPHLKVDLKVVGTVIPNSQVSEDEIDALGDNPVLLTPALMRKLVPCCAFYTFTYIKVDGGSRNVPTVLNEILRALPELGPAGRLGSGSRTSVAVAKAERAIAPESIALGVFGAIAAIAALLIAGQLIGRQLRSGADERAVLRALGASSATTVADGLIGVYGAVALGVLAAGAIAVALSPLAPLGPVRRVEHASLAFDWTVLGIGVAAIGTLLGVTAITIAYRQAPRGGPGHRRRMGGRGSRSARAAANSGLPIASVMGVRFALEPGAERDAVPVRSAILGAVLAMVVVISTLTFGTSLRTLVSHPRLYGWNWNYALLGGFSGDEDLPQHQVETLLEHDPYVSHWAGVYFAGVDIEGHAVQVLATSPRAPVAPPLLSGHGLDAPNQIVLGASTLAELHERVGDTIVVRSAKKRATKLRIVGTATMPAFGSGMTMGTGAVVSSKLFSVDRLNQQHNTVPGPNAYLIRIAGNASPATALRSLTKINDTINKSPEAPAGGVIDVLRPAEIVNYRSMGTTPALLGVTLAVGAITALALTLIASVRRRRRELALLKTLGLTRRQLAAIVAWQSTIAVGIGVIVGVPTGIVIGRSLWNLFARSIHAVPEPTVPAVTIALIAVGALVLANLVAAVPGLQAARTRTAVLLRAE